MSQQVHNTVFISYRRSVSAYLAHAIYLDLKSHGYDVFMDVEDIDSGKFDEIILRQIEARAHFLILCSPGTFERINESGDWLRREIEHAMKFKRNIVPIMASDFKFDDGVKSLLTGKIASLHRYNGVDFPYNYFPEAMTRLRTRFLKPVAVTIAPTPVADANTVAEKQADVEARPAPTRTQLSAEEYVLRGIAHRDRGDNEGAIAEYNRALQINPNYAEAYARRGGRYHEQGKVREAIADFEKALSLDPENVIAYTNRGAARAAKGDLDGAIADFNEGLRLNPKYADAYHNRGSTRMDKQDYDGAIADFSEAIRLNSQYAISYYGRGISHMQRGDNHLALADFLKYMELAQSNPDSRFMPAVEKQIGELKQKLGIK